MLTFSLAYKNVSLQDSIVKFRMSDEVRDNCQFSLITEMYQLNQLCYLIFLLYPTFVCDVYFFAYQLSNMLTLNSVQRITDRPSVLMLSVCTLSICVHLEYVYTERMCTAEHIAFKTFDSVREQALTHALERFIFSVVFALFLSKSY